MSVLYSINKMNITSLIEYKFNNKIWFVAWYKYKYPTRKKWKFKDDKYLIDPIVEYKLSLTNEKLWAFIYEPYEILASYFLWLKENSKIKKNKFIFNHLWLEFSWTYKRTLFHMINFPSIKNYLFKDDNTINSNNREFNNPIKKNKFNEENDFENKISQKKIRKD